MSEAARKVLREGFLPLWTTAVLEKALALLKSDSPILLQGSTSFPPPFMSAMGQQVEKVDLIAFCAAPDALEMTVGDVEEAFARACFDADQKLGEPAACRFWLNTWDDYTRSDAFKMASEEIRAEIQRRATSQLDPALQIALTQFPDDQSLKMACTDYLLEKGLEKDSELFRQCWEGW